ncbi:tail fiber protein [Paenibacillus algorifonticola]|uniref:phage tail protein n=1 Tax=Paenibacillus algorifonticola TaxID=684063 RepID=UPI003D2C7F49
MDAYLGEIRLFTGDFAPAGWEFCHGQQIPILGNQALFTIIGGQFGSDKTSYFKLPDLRGLVPMHHGTGDGLTARECYETGGSRTETILQSEMPNHTHSINAQTVANTTDAVSSIWANQPRGTTTYAYNESPNTTMHPLALQVSGGSQPHNNMQPFVAINYIICMEGIYPPKQ